jgi:protein-L-isoaspartate(D-aspartate) O-methyltransferase
MAARRVSDSYEGYRARLVEALSQNGIRDMSVLAAFGNTPRHLFVPEALRNRAYDDASLPIGNGQTISQPTTHARYLEAIKLTGGERVLEIGTGSGFQTALLAFLADHVVSVERVPELAQTAGQALTHAGVRNACVVVGDGSLGWRAMGPYDAILVGAVAPAVPRPLLEQLADGGQLIIPLQQGNEQSIVRIRRTADGFEMEELGPANFVKLYGKHGY